MVARVAIYVRLSKDREASTSIERQLDDCRAKASLLGDANPEIFQDVDISGFLDVARPGRDELVERLGEFSHVVIWKLDRLARSVLDASTIFDLCIRRGVALVSVNDGIDLSTASGLAYAQMASVFAQLESANIGLRVRSARAHLKAHGYWAAGRPTYGYQIVPALDGKHKTLEVVPEEALIVETMAAHILAGESSHRTAQLLNEAGHRRRGRDWTGRAVTRALESQTILGYVVNRGEPERGPDGLPIVAWDPLLPLSTFYKVQERLARNRDARPRRSKADHQSKALLRGVVVCDECGHHSYLGSQGKDRHGRERPYVYRCSSPCNRRIAQRLLEDTVLTLTLVALGRAEQVTERPPQEVDTSSIDLQMEDLQQAFIDGHVDAQWMGSTMARLDAKKTALLAATPEPERDVSDVYDSWNDMTNAERAAVVGDLVEVRTRAQHPRIKVVPLVDGLTKSVAGVLDTEGAFGGWIDGVPISILREDGTIKGFDELIALGGEIAPEARRSS